MTAIRCPITAAPPLTQGVWPAAPPESVQTTRCQWEPRPVPSPGLAINSFFSVSFLKKIIDLPGGQINDPSSGKHYSLPFLPATPSSPSWTLEGLFELTRSPSRALNLDAYIASELQRCKDTVRCGALGAKVPGHSKEQLTQTLIVRLLKMHFLH